MDILIAVIVTMLTYNVSKTKVTQNTESEEEGSDSSGSMENLPTY